MGIMLLEPSIGVVICIHTGTTIEARLVDTWMRYLADASAIVL